MRTLAATIASVRSYYSFPAYLDAICNEIIINAIDRAGVDQFIRDFDMDPAEVKIDLLNFINEFTWNAVQADVLTANEREQVNFLKGIFNIQPGEFFQHLREEAENIALYPSSEFYRRSKKLSENALTKTEVLEMFDFTPDQIADFLLFVQAESQRIGKRLDEVTVFFPPTNYFKARGGTNEEFAKN
jgi:hypothetical protein